MKEYFKQQDQKPFTEGMLRQRQALFKLNKFPVKAVVAETKYLKGKFGLCEYKFYLKEGETLSLKKIWEDELDLLDEYSFIGYKDNYPIMEKTDD